MSGKLNLFLENKSVHENLMMKKASISNLVRHDNPNFNRERSANASHGNPIGLPAAQVAQICFGGNEILRHTIRNHTAGDLFLGFSSTVNNNIYDDRILASEERQIEGTKNVFAYSVAGGTIKVGREGIKT